MGSVISSIVAYNGLFKRAQSEVTSEGMLLMEMLNSVRQYTGERVKPHLDELPESGDFIAEKIPSYSTRVIFGNFRSINSYQNYRYKEASLNPRNPGNRANDFEARLLAEFSRDPNQKELSGFQFDESTRLYYIARPLVVASTSCLVCHGDTADAPRNLIDEYGTENAFGWKVGDIIAAQIVYVPASLVYQEALASSLLVILVLLLSLVAVIYLINRLLKNDVLKPIDVLSDVAEKIRTDDLQSKDLDSDHLAAVTGRSDELGQLSRIFQRMARELHIRTEGMKREIMQLRIEIDQVKRRDHVQEVVKSDFFKKLRAEARKQKALHAKDNT
jgi:HAMP domain-containing protein